MKMMKVSYKDYQKALKESQREIDTETEKCFGERRLIELQNTSIDDDHPIKMGLNWAAIGTVQGIVAADFAKCLSYAVGVAERFEYNGDTIEW